MKLTEADIKFRFIEPSFEAKGWKKVQIRKEHYFTDGKIVVLDDKVATERGRRLITFY